MTGIDEITVHITVTARLDRHLVADLYEALGDAAEFFCGDRVTMRQSEARASSGRRGRPPVSENIDRCLGCGERLPGEGGTFNRAKAIVRKGWRAVIARCRRLFWDDDFGITISGMVVGHVVAWAVGLGVLWLVLVR